MDWFYFVLLPGRLTLVVQSIFANFSSCVDCAHFVFFRPKVSLFCCEFVEDQGAPPAVSSSSPGPIVSKHSVCVSNTNVVLNK